MRVLSMRMNPLECPLGRRRGFAEDEMSRSVQQHPCAYIGQILDRTDQNYHNDPIQPTLVWETIRPVAFGCVRALVKPH
jgi:hypothetical protein